MDNELNPSLSTQLVSSFYAYQTLKFIGTELVDNVDTGFTHEHLFAQMELLGMMIERMMNNAIK